MFKLFEKNRGLSILITIVLASVIFILSSIPFPGLPAGSNWMTVVYHIVIFFLFSMFLFISFKGNKKLRVWQIFIVLLISIIYAFSDEFHQLFVIGRSASLRDVLYDTTGIFFSVFIYSVFSSKKYNKAEDKAYNIDVKDQVNGE